MLDLRDLDRLAGLPGLDSVLPQLDEDALAAEVDTGVPGCGLGLEDRRESALEGFDIFQRSDVRDRVDAREPAQRPHLSQTLQQHDALDRILEPVRDLHGHAT